MLIGDWARSFPCSRSRSDFFRLEPYRRDAEVRWPTTPEMRSGREFFNRDNFLLDISLFHDEMSYGKASTTVVRKRWEFIYLIILEEFGEEDGVCVAARWELL